MVTPLAAVDVNVLSAPGQRPWETVNIARFGILKIASTGTGSWAATPA